MFINQADISIPLTYPSWTSARSRLTAPLYLIAPSGHQRVPRQYYLDLYSDDDLIFDFTVNYSRIGIGDDIDNEQQRLVAGDAKATSSTIKIEKDQVDQKAGGAQLSLQDAQRRNRRRDNVRVEDDARRGDRLKMKNAMTIKDLIDNPMVFDKNRSIGKGNGQR